MTVDRAAAHHFQDVRSVLAYVLSCSCGWTSNPSVSAQDVGAEWDRHMAYPPVRSL